MRSFHTGDRRAERQLEGGSKHTCLPGKETLPKALLLWHFKLERNALPEANLLGLLGPLRTFDSYSRIGDVEPARCLLTHFFGHVLVSLPEVHGAPLGMMPIAGPAVDA